MKEYLPIIKARSGLFRGIEESELESCSAAWKRESRPIEKKNIF